MADRTARRRGRAARPGVAVVGCGAWGHNRERCFAELGALAAVVDHHPDPMAALARRHGCRALDFEDALADPMIDAIATATQPSRDGPLAPRRPGRRQARVRKVARPRPRRGAGDGGGSGGGPHPDGRSAPALPAGVPAARGADGGGRARRRAPHLRYAHEPKGDPPRGGSAVVPRAPRSFDDPRAGLRGAGPGRRRAIDCFARTWPTSRPCISGFPPARAQPSGPGPRPGPGRARTGGATVDVSWLHPVKEQRLVVVGSAAMAMFHDVAAREAKLVFTARAGRAAARSVRPC
jgi:hypothetical protein